jgi:hypothetical protein
MFFFVVEVKEG